MKKDDLGSAKAAGHQRYDKEFFYEAAKKKPPFQEKRLSSLMKKGKKDA